MADKAGSMDGFAAEVRTFLDRCALDASAPRRPGPAQAVAWGEGADQIAYFSTDPPDVDRANADQARQWQRRRFDAGLGWITGPVEFGGRGLSTAHDLVYDAIEADYDVPDTGVLSVIGLGMIGPTILAHAQPHVRQKYLPAMYAGDVIACQLFSEPGAGSDLASLSTRAEQDEATATGCSTARRSGRRSRSTRTSAWRCAAPALTSPSTRASRHSSWT